MVLNLNSSDVKQCHVNFHTVQWVFLHSVFWKTYCFLEIFKILPKTALCENQSKGTFIPSLVHTMYSTVMAIDSALKKTQQWYPTLVKKKSLLSNHTVHSNTIFLFSFIKYLILGIFWPFYHKWTKDMKTNQKPYKHCMRSNSSLQLKFLHITDVTSCKQTPSMCYCVPTLTATSLQLQFYQVLRLKNMNN